MARRCDVVFDIGAGDSFTDQYGVKRFWYHTISKAVVLTSGTPLVLAPQTIGPFSRAWARQVARIVMRRCTAVVTRDNLSTAFVRALDPAIPLAETTDVAFRLTYKNAAIARGQKIRVGINVSGLLFGGGYTGKNQFDLRVDYPKLMREIVRRFAARADCEVHLVSHVIVPRRIETVEDDYRVSERIAQEFEGVLVAPAFRSPGEAKSYIASMDFFCGSRMHACIAAFSSGVPTVPIAYSRKFAGLFETLGYPFVADCREDSDETVLRKVEEGFEHREKLRDTVAAANIEAGSRIERYKALIRECLSEPTDRR